MNIMTIYTVQFILLQIFTVGSMNFCDNIDGTHVCCQGYKLDVAQNTCIPCERGFTGINCVTTCTYPAYGQGCQSLCNCNATHMYCHHANGCVRFSENQIQSSTHMNLRTVTKEQMTLESNSSNEDVFNIMSDNLTNFKSTICDTRKRQFKGNNTYMFVIIGLAAVSFYHIYDVLLRTYVREPPFEHQFSLENLYIFRDLLKKTHFFLFSYRTS